MLQLAIYSVVARLPTVEQLNAIMSWLDYVPTVEQFNAPARPKPILITTRPCLRLLILKSFVLPVKFCSFLGEMCLLLRTKKQ